MRGIEARERTRAACVMRVVFFMRAVRVVFVVLLALPCEAWCQSAPVKRRDMRFDAAADVMQRRAVGNDLSSLVDRQRIPVRDAVLSPLLPVSPLQLRPNDAWRHAGSSAAIQFMAYGGLRTFSVHRRDALVTSIGASLLAGIGKELYDRAGHGDASARDLFWDVVGIGAGVGLSRLTDR